MYYGLDALAHGAVAALVVLLPAVALFWLLTRGLDGPRALRPFVTVCAAYGVAAGGAGLWAGNFERPNFVDEAMTGALIIGAVAGVVAFLILLLLPRGR
jgi:hypothetical protein